MDIVILDGYTSNPGDLSWDALRKHGALTVYDHTPAELTVERARDAEVVISNKTVLGAAQLDRLPKLRYIGLLSTGYDAVDLDAARRHGVAVANIPAYSTPSVAQLVFALLLELTSHVAAHGASVRAGEWERSRDFCYWKHPLVELAGKTMGVVGFGSIGREVAKIAGAFGMEVLACRRPQPGAQPGGDASAGAVRLTSLEGVLSGSDVVSLHCPLFPETTGLIDRDAIALMKPGALLVNTARGGVIDERDVADALADGRLGGAGLDVLSTEPPRPDNPLLKAPNCVITPHIAWATREARTRLLRVLEENLAAFLAGRPQNLVGV
ncbi:MAG: D-2-hydroxyacid dehydrogenase [Acidobacteriota bacterium]|jgi:glycerate dehydrogenase|nr:D-2-hydroxyacid dehydrogenase [Acidobacteriota bacterium]